jgi:hypothetical protein
MRFLVRFFGAVAITVTSTLQAQTTDERLAQCAAVTVPSFRLECYDVVAGRKSDTTTSASPSQHGARNQKLPQNGAPNQELPEDVRKIENWMVKVETDPMTDQKQISFLLQAENSTTTDTPTLAIRCKRGELDVIVAPDEYLGSDNDKVTLRWGAESPVKESWSPASTHRALFVPGGRVKVENFVRRLANYNHLVIEVRPYEQGPRTMVFPLAGAPQVNQELWAVCPPKSK